MLTLLLAASIGDVSGDRPLRWQHMRVDVAAVYPLDMKNIGDNVTVPVTWEVIGANKKTNESVILILDDPEMFPTIDKLRWNESVGFIYVRKSRFHQPRIVKIYP